MGLETLPKIPIVDFSKENLKPGTDSWFPACNNVRHALEEVWLFHGSMKQWQIHPPKHRVIVKENEVRYTIELFSFTNGMIKIPEELVDDHHPLQFKSFDHIGLIYFLGTKEARNSASPLKAYYGL
uniref:Uncharacterized protein n=1 Tax=Vitis vinifera TaxID=29760 RepID=F6HX50_VITVI